MKANWVRTAFVCLITGSLGIGFLGVGCDDNPVDEGREDAAGVIVNPGFAVVDAADTTAVQANAVSRYGDATRDAVTFTACDATISIAPDPTRVTAEPPERWLVIGNTLGESCVEVSTAGFRDTAGIAVVPASIVVTAAPDTLRAGDTGEVVVQTLAADGSPVGPFTRTDAAYSVEQNPEVEDATVATLTDDMGGFSTTASGQAEITSVWSGGGITRSVDHTVVVIANVPASAAFESSSFGALAADDTVELEVVLSDALGNKNTNENDILGVTVQSSDPGVATVFGELRPSSSVNVIVGVVGVGSGTTDVSGFVTTTAGDIVFGPAPALVLNPIISGISPSSGPAADAATISGSGFDFSAAGFETAVLVDGTPLGNITVVADNQIDVEMPTLRAGTYDVQVDVGGVLSNVDAWTQTADFAEGGTEPANDLPGTAPGVSMPFDFFGTTGGSDVEDMFVFTLTSESSLDINLGWDTGKDFDVLVYAIADAIPFDTVGFSNYGLDQCEATGATSANPEHASCTDLAPGTYVLHVIDFDGAFGDGTATSWTATGTISQ